MATVSIERYIDASERVYPMESMCLMSCLLPLVVPTVPCPLFPPPKINPKAVYPMEVTLKVDLHIPECRPK